MTEDGCDLLKNKYLCRGINIALFDILTPTPVVIC